ncbi:MAG: hypothetical protein J7L43_01135 [Candidatus Aenigmarchaeota archaeon]|nr:hypothetical protein [Candidatus Aenigmarchaeota archaeon]
MRGITEFAEALEDVIMIIFFGVLIWTVNTTILGYETQVDNTYVDRLSIDVAEMFMGSNCYAEEKGILLADKLENLGNDKCLHWGDKWMRSRSYSDISIEITVKSDTGKKWEFDEGSVPDHYIESTKIFPVLIKYHNGEIHLGMIKVRVLHGV